MSELAIKLKRAVAGVVLATNLAGCVDTGPQKPFTTTIIGNEGSATPLNLQHIASEIPTQIAPTTSPTPERISTNPNICTKNCTLFPLDQTHRSLSKEYVPPLMAIDNTYLTDKNKTLFLEPATGTQITLLLDALRKTGAMATINSGYRSYDDQEKLRNEELANHLVRNKTRSEAENAIARTVAKPGHSEHQLGAAVDLQFDVRFNVLIAKVALEYGFVQTMVGNSDMNEEIWHFRYIGMENVQEYKDFIAGKITKLYSATPQGYFEWKFTQESKTIGAQR